jgi:hypothetical protein
MKYDNEKGSDAMIYVPSFIMIDPGIQEPMGWVRRHTDNMVIP